MGSTTIAVVVFVLFWVVVFYFLLSTPGKRYRSLVQVFDNGSVKVQPSSTGIEGLFRGRPARIYEWKASARGSSETVFRISCTAPLSFRAIRLPKTVINYGAVPAKGSTGDPDLDKDYGITTPDPDRFNAWVQRPENKHALMSLTAAATPGAHCWVNAGDGCVLWSSGLNMWQLKPETVKPVLERMEAFACALEKPA